LIDQRDHTKDDQKDSDDHCRAHSSPHFSCYP
jgi:hypothetical protein